MSLWKYLDEFPPPMVRILARRRRGKIKTTPLTDSEIAIGAQLPMDRVVEIMFSPSWDGIELGHIRRFLKGCNFDPTNYQDRHRAQVYAQKGEYKFWKKSSLYESHFLPLREVLRKHYVRSH